MIIRRILTNNAVVVTNNNREQIVCGKGIAYKKRIGDVIDETLINQTFVLKPDNKIQQQMEQLLVSLPIEYVEIANKIVTIARNSMQVKLSDSLIISLADHIFETMRRYREGIQLSNGMIWDIQRFYETEYDIGLLAKEIVERQFDAELTNDEAAYIAIHIANAETEGSTIDETVKITKLIQDIVRVVKIHFGIELDEKSGYYYRFISHLKYFSRRVLRREQFSKDNESELAGIIFLKYSDEYQCAQKIGEHVNKNLHYNVSDEEYMYLTIHLHTMLSKGSKKKGKEDR